MALTEMKHDLVGRVVLITGASRGLGRATAQRFLARGATVAVNVRTPERAESLVRELGENAYPAPGDVRDAEVVRAIVRDIGQRLGRLDVLVNNAAIASAARIEQLAEDDWRATIDTNLTAAFLCIQSVIPMMKSQCYGRIVNVSSLAGRSVSTLGGAHYTASKAGLLGLTRAAAKELGAYGITVNAVCPGLFDTEIIHEYATQERLDTLSKNFPISRLGTREEVADLICFLAGESAGYITGASFDINGGSLMI